MEVRQAEIVLQTHQKCSWQQDMSANEDMIGVDQHKLLS